MNGSHWQWPIYACSLLLVCAAGGHAQNRQTFGPIASDEAAVTSLVEIPVDQKRLADFQKRILMAELLRDPGSALRDERIGRELKAILDSNEFKKLRLDPELQKQMELLKGHLGAPKGQPGHSLKLPESAAQQLKELNDKNPGWQESIKRMVNSVVNDNGRPATPAGSEAASAATPAASPNNPDGGEDSAPAEEAGPDAFERWLLRQTERAGQWSQRFGSSPALQQALHSAKLAVTNTDWQKQRGTMTEGYLSKQLLRLGRQLHPERFLEDLNLSANQRMGKTPLARMRLSKLRVPWDILPSLGLPSFGSSPTSGPSSDNSLIWLLVAAVSAQVLWFLHHRRKQAQAARHAQAASRTWPVTPTAISTRDDLIKAFEFLSLLKLGPQARTWNHLDIAAALGANGNDQRQAADRLAALYEQARYAPGDEPLSSEAFGTARRELTFLAGAGAA